MNRQEFASTMNSFNNVVQNHPPPPSFSSGRAAFLILCLSASILCAIILGIHYTRHIAMLLAVPSSFLALSIILIAWRRRLMLQFEAAILHLCSCMNATENVRGINFRLAKVSPDHQNLASSTPTLRSSPVTSSVYSIVVEFDDRYNLLHHFAASPNSGQQTSLSTRIHGANTLPPYRSSLIEPPTYRQSQQQLQSQSNNDVQFPSNTYHPNEKT
ncbi:hypothetical protein INT45_001938 [Circinella minor]|uniref:Uncharacterized protein n=1 Tax=Circinella minor TaxID=1195481 RepID=A0A8H7S6S2_9FUNG|nr:hypothetical protein INT45_001938 [Circinella minor]